MCFVLMKNCVRVRGRVRVRIGVRIGARHRGRTERGEG